MCVCVGSDVGAGRPRAARRETKQISQKSLRELHERLFAAKRRQRRIGGASRAPGDPIPGSVPRKQASCGAVAQIPLRFSVAGGVWMSQEDANSAEIEFASRRSTRGRLCEL